jgi:hypothetical protein
MKLSDYLTAINKSKENIMDTEDETVEKQYVPFLINRCLSNFPDTIFQTNEMNIHHNIEKRLQFDFLMNSIRPRSRYSKWLKSSKINYLEDVKQYYGYSNQKAKDAIKILTKEQLENIRNMISGVRK